VTGCAAYIPGNFAGAFHRAGGSGFEGFLGVMSRISGMVLGAVQVLRGAVQFVSSAHRSSLLRNEKGLVTVAGIGPGEIIASAAA
jgi:hypothetical protein